MANRHPTQHPNLFTLVINAGGASRRMGRTKALLPMPLADGTTRPLLAHIAAQLRPLSPARVVVVTNDETVVANAEIAQPVEFVADAFPDAGPLGGIATALALVDEWAIVVACDMPLVDAAVVGRLCEIAAAAQCDAVVPQVGPHLQTLHAIYHRRCLPTIEQQLAAKEYQVNRIFPHVHTQVVTEESLRPLDPDLRSFMNVNRPEDWADFLRSFVE